jgi:hypothetical protein
MRFYVVSLVVMASISLSVAKDNSQTANFVKEHLNSIGTDQARAAVRNRLVQGDVTSQILNRGPQTWEGPATLVSEGDKMSSLFKFPPTVYRTEWFTRNGNKSSIEPVTPGRWTPFGDFIKTHDEILTEGLWGGILTTGWALSDLDERRARLQDRGVKKVDGTELHRLDYIPKKSSDLEIQLYFEPSTSRHVMTVYLMTVTAHSGRSVNDARNEQEIHYRLEERFGDFTTVDNLNLPTRWVVRFTHGPSSSGIMDQYEVTAKKISHNVALDPKNFEIK